MDDREIFDAASAAEAPAETPAAVTEQPEVPAAGAEEGKVRDPATGRFAPKAEPAAAAATEQPTARTTEQPQADHRIPLAEHLSEREKRQAAERDRDELRRQMETMSRRVDELSRPKPQAPKRPDIWQDPDGFTAHAIREQVDPIQQQQDAMIDRFSRLMAVQTFGKETVDAAFAELEAEVRGNPSMALEAQRIWQNEHPYGALIDWAKSRKALKEIGNDPAAYEAKLRERLLADPEFQKAVAAKIQAAAGTAAPGTTATRPNVVVRLPPSLTRATSAAPNTPAAEGEIDDRELFHFASKGK